MKACVRRTAVILGVLALIAAVLLGARLAVRRAIVAYVSRSVGMPLRVERMRAGLWPPVIEVRNARFLNPPDFSPGEAVVLRELRIEYDRSSLFGDDAFRINRLVIDVPHVLLERLPDGRTNLEGMRTARGRRPRKEVTQPPPPKDPQPPDRRPPHDPSPDRSPDPDRPPPAPPATPQPSPPRRELHIDELTVRLGKAEYRQPAQNGESALQVFDIDKERTFNEVSDLQAVIQQLAMEIAAEQLMRQMREGGDLRNLFRSRR